MASVEEAFAHCASLTRGHYENFPVGSFLLPAARRTYIWAIYAFARTADDFADEGRFPGEGAVALQKRIELLDDYELKLVKASRGDAHDLVFLALAQTLKDLDIPVQLLKDLLT